MVGRRKPHCVLSRNTGQPVLQRGGTRFLADDCQPDSGWISGAVKHRFFRRQRASFRTCTLLFSVNSELLHPPLHLLFFPFSVHFFRTTPSRSLKRRAFFKLRPHKCYFCPLNNPLANPRNCPHCGQKWTGWRRKAPSLFSCFAACGFSLCRNPLAGILFLLLPFLHRSRTSAQRLVLSPLVGTRSAGRRKRHKPPTRARRAVTGVLAVRSTCVFNKIGIFSPCCVLVQLLHLPVIVLLECRLNRLDCE